MEAVVFLYKQLTQGSRMQIAFLSRSGGADQFRLVPSTYRLSREVESWLTEQNKIDLNQKVVAFKEINIPGNLLGFDDTHQDFQAICHAVSDLISGISSSSTNKLEPERTSLEPADIDISPLYGLRFKKDPNVINNFR